MLRIVLQPKYLIPASLLLFGIGLWLFTDWFQAIPSSATPQYVGRETCATCHRKEYELYQNSHHDLAMDIATDGTVRADFENVQLEHLGVPARFFRDGKRFMVNTEGPDGKLANFEVKYVFGFKPLQQYMVEFDRTKEHAANEIARVQVLRWSWDTERKRWFHLDPPDVKERLAPNDDLHWTGIAQRWQTMCAECHSTNLQKNFDVKTASYRTTFNEIDVSCEACHGPASLHVQIAQSNKVFWDRNWGYGLTVKLKGADAEPQLQTCAHCHSRRQLLQEEFSNGHYWESHDLERLHNATYFADGQIRDEVYEYGSFLQSRMYHKGIRCTDCHDPHSARLKFEGNQVCTSCHQHPAGKYDVPSHHHHAPGTPGAQCVNCHMPTRTYMEVDPRRDHSFRIPRPDLSVKLGTPNACTGCHLDPKRVPDAQRGELKDYAAWQQAAENKSTDVIAEIERVNQWCDEACDRWYGTNRRRDPHFASAMTAAQNHSPDASEQLEKIILDRQNTPAIARATALDELALREGLTSSFMSKVAEDPHPLVRAAGIQALRARDARQAIQTTMPLLDDSSRLVRIRAAQSLLLNATRDGSSTANELNSTQSTKVDQVLEELRRSLDTFSDRSGSHLTWGILQEARGQPRAAIEAYETAIRVEPTTVGPRSNLAELLTQMLQSESGTEAQQERVKAYIDQLRRDELPLMERDAKLAPEMPYLQFRLGQMRYLAGKSADAVEPVRRAILLSPNEVQYRLFLTLLLQSLQRIPEAIDEAKAMIAIAPDRADLRQVLDELRASQRTSKTQNAPDNATPTKD